MSFNGSEGEEITLTEAAGMTANYREENPNETKGHFMGKTLIQAILDQTDCVGIRIYYGIDDEGNKELILVGVDENEDDLYEGKIGDKMKPCPSYCGSSNPLNSDT